MLLVGVVALARAAAAQRPAVAVVSPGVAESGDGVNVRLVDVDLRVAVQALARYLDRPVLVVAPSAPGAGVPRVTLETPRALARADVPRLLRGVVESQGWEMVTDDAAGLYRVRVKDVPRPPAPEMTAVGQSARSGGFPGGGAPELFVIRLRHARAADVAATVNALYGRASALGEPGGGRGGTGGGSPNGSASGYAPTLGQQLGTVPPYLPGASGPGQSATPNGTSGAAPGSGGATPPSGMQAVAGVTGRTAAFAGEVTIIPDPGTNALLVRANRGDAELVQAAVRELDVRPLQVLIEVVIAEISRSRALDLGITGTVPQTTIPQTSGVTGVTAGATLTPAGVGLGDFALRIMKTVGHLQFDATLSAAASRGEARILARPVVLAANNEAAEILVGSQRPFVQISRSLPTDNAARDQVVQYREVGTKLTVRPTISGDGYVSIAVTQEVSAATTEQQFNAPVISTRTVQTVLLVRDSQMVVLGGLMDREHQATQNGIPVLSSIPLLGGLFGHVTRQLNDTEFFLFLTPHIVRTDADADGISQPYERRSGARPP